MISALSPAFALTMLRRLIRRGPTLALLALVVTFGLGVSAGPAICTKPLDCCTHSAGMLDCIANAVTTCFATCAGIEAAALTYPAVALSDPHLAGSEALGTGLRVQPELPPPRV